MQLIVMITNIKTRFDAISIYKGYEINIMALTQSLLFVQINNI